MQQTHLVPSSLLSSLNQEMQFESVTLFMLSSTLTANSAKAPTATPKPAKATLSAISLILSTTTKFPSSSSSFTTTIVLPFLVASSSYSLFLAITDPIPTLKNSNPLTTSDPLTDSSSLDHWMNKGKALGALAGRARSGVGGRQGWMFTVGLVAAWYSSNIGSGAGGTMLFIFRSGLKMLRGVGGRFFGVTSDQSVVEITRLAGLSGVARTWEVLRL